MSEQNHPKNPRRSISENLDHYLSDIFRLYAIPGLAVAVVRDEQTIFSKGFGFRDISANSALVTETVFHMASLAKPVTATAVMKLVEMGKLELDAPLVAYLPYFSMADPLYRQITVRQMLNHTSGIPDIDDYHWDKPETDDASAERYVRGLQDKHLVAEPGEKYSYSNMAYNVLADLIAKVSGQLFEDFIKQQIFTPLKMPNSSMLLADIPAISLATPYTSSKELALSDINPTAPLQNPDRNFSAGTVPYSRCHAASSTLYSSVEDMARWLAANLNRGVLDNVRILEQQSYQQLWQSYTTTDEILGIDSHIGLGWFIGRFNNELTISHLGHDSGYWSNMVLMPERKSGFIISSNYDLTPLVLIRDTLLNILLDNESALPGYLCKMER